MQKPFTLLLLFCSIGLYAINPPLKRSHNQPTTPVADQPTFSCSMPAYLLQGSPTDAYAVNLSTGETTLVKNNLIGPGIGGRQIQAVGYNVLDNYLWGYRTGTDQLVRIGGDWSVQFFTISGLAIAGYDVGDIDANGIMYLSTGNSTIKRIDLNPSSPTYLQALSDLTSTGTTIADWTVNVADGNIYAINQSSLLLRYNTTTGVRTTLGVVQWSVTTGTGFGAAYSDSEGNVYVQDNQGGKIFKIDKPHLLPASTNAQIAGNLFANTGMTTSSNDGTRCMNAPPPCQAPARPDGYVTPPGCLTQTGSISLTAPMGADIQYNVNAGAYQAVSGFTGLTPGSYTVTAKNRLTGCVSAATTFTVAAIPAAPSSPVVSVVHPTCLIRTGSITVVSPSTGVEYSFDNGASYQSGNVKSGLASGVYELKVRSTASGCESAPVSVTVNAAPAVPAMPTANVVQPTCTVSTGTITVNTPASGVAYSFDNGASYQSGNVKSGLTSGVYQLKMRSTASGCESGPVSVTVNAAPTVPAAPMASVVQPTCAVSTGTVTISSPSTGVAYSFDNGLSYQSGNVKSGLASGVYQLKVRSTASGCESAPVSVTVNAAPEVPANPTASVLQPTCTVSTGTITVNMPASGVGYSFDNGASYQAGNVKSGLVAGIYQLKVRSTASGCEAESVSATVNAAPVVPAMPIANVVQPNCLTLTGTAAIISSSTNQWYSFTGGVDFQESALKTAIVPGTKLTILTKDKESGCLSAALSVIISDLANCPPVARPNAGTVLLGSSLTGNLLTDDYDPEEGNLRISRITANGINYTLNNNEPISITIPGNGTLTVDGNGMFTFLPTPAFTGPIPVIDYVVSDDAGATAMATLALFVNKIDLQLIAPIYECASGKLIIQMKGGDGSAAEWRASGLTDWTTNLSATIPDELRSDPKTIILYVRQSGYVVTYAFDLVAACGDCSPGPDKPLRLKIPVLNCKGSTVCIATCGGDGSAITYKIDNVSEWNTEACVMAGDDLVHRDPKVLFIRVRQGTQEQVFEYNLPLISAACPDSTRPWNQRIPVAPPPPSTTTTIPGSPTGNTGQPMALLEPLYSCGTGVITFRYQGGDGQPVEYMAVGVTGWTTQAIHHVEEALRLEQPPVLIYARQGSSLVSYLFDLKGYCQKAAVPLPPPPATTSAQPASPVSLTLLPPLYDCQTGGLRFQVAGGDNSPIEFMAVGITGWTTRTEHTLEAVIRESGETVRIFARQQGIVSSLLWSPAQACGSGGRQAQGGSGLQVQLLGNPVLTSHAVLRLTGLRAGKAVRVLCYDSQGRFVSSTAQEPLTESVSISVKLGQMAGIYVISVLADGQQVQVKAVKP